MTKRRGAFAIAIVSASVAAVGGCFSLKADDDLPFSDAGTIDASSKDAAHNSARDATTRLDHDALPEASGEDTTIGQDVEDAADIEDVADASDSADGADALGDGTDDGSLDAGNASDFYVNLTPPDGGPTYPTIHAALDAANASSAPTRTIHVGPGTYSTAESFPIVLRDGVSLVGSAANDASTILSGLGPAAWISPPGVSSSVASTDVMATVVVGDSTKASTIAHLSILAAPPNVPGTEAIACDRGVTSVSAPGPTPPNTFIDDVTIDGYEIGINVASSSPSRAGCAALVTRSTLENGSYGVVAAGWLSSFDYSPLQLVSVQLGDGTPDGGDVFQNLHDTPGSVGSGAGLVSLDGVTGVQVIGNRFSNSDQGIWVNQYNPSDKLSGIDVEQNDIGSMANSGIQVWGPTIVAKLIGNTLHDIPTSTPAASFLAPGLVLQTNGTPTMPTVSLARGNTFFGNDVGVLFRSGEQLEGSTVDFGTAADPGRNVFRCNYSPVSRSNGNGGDVLVSLVNTTGLSLPFEGNVWDHAPPTPFPTGNDLTIEGDVTVDVANASAATSPACPANRIAGP